MYLITVQKVLQSLELALRQGIDHTALLLKTREIFSNLHREAELVEEDELAQGAGQVLAYLDTVLEGRLVLDEEGVHTVTDFAVIFKDALGDAAPGIQRLDRGHLEEWDERYQDLMARMKPIEEDAALADLDEPPPEEPTPKVVEIPASNSESDDLSPDLREDEDSEPAVEEASIGAATTDPVAAEFEDADVELPAVEESEEIPLVEATAEFQMKDDVIADAELKSARELLESNEPLPEPASVYDLSRPHNLAVEKSAKNGAQTRWNGDGQVKTPVQLEEVERLKKKLLQLHEKQEMLSSKMSGILGDLKKNVQPEPKERGEVSIEKMDVNEIEDLIFIGRKKG